ncbi:MAG TPA: TRAP transporter small permease [Burkholderiales bacterium]|nr:TRAP transporter small permease [Burkholderiales bacterium]
MRRALDSLYSLSGAAAAICLAGIGALMLAQALVREFGVLIRGSDDITAWLCAASAFFALGHTFRHGELVRVGLWIDMLGTQKRRYAEVLALTITALFVAYMTWAVARFVYDSWQFHEVAQGLIKLPIWIPQLSFLAGVAIFLIAVLDELVTVLRGQKPAYQVAEDERRARGDFSEMA